MERRNNDWSFVVGIALVVLGVWLLGGRVLGPFWEPVRVAVHWISRLAWPLLVVAVGVLFIVASRRGTIHAPATGTRLYRSRKDRMLTGVAAGLGDYFGIDPTWVRIAFVVVAIATGFGPAVFAYIIATIVIPEEPAVPPVVDQWPTTSTPASAPTPPVANAPAPPASEPPSAPQPPTAPGA